MTEENKRKCRAEIEKGGWLKLGIIEPTPSPLLWDKEVEIMYEDMDGYPCTCNAIYKYSAFGSYFIATNGSAKGNRMCKVFAYREIKEREKNGWKRII